ncbi:MAG: hypothetical protein GPJ52_11525 [Candidatus Heimdallarchaeota archaeon]|nr:hypothetical protein [Candidatus Heimdallarchaeota archaeon]
MLQHSGGTTFIKGKIEFDKVTGEPLGDVNFHVKIYDESHEKIYSMKGKLKDGAVMFLPYYYCNVRQVYWTNLWLIMGEGEIKTTDTILTIDYRGLTITLPNTGGKYIPSTIMMLVNPTGEYVGGVDELDLRETNLGCFYTLIFSITSISKELLFQDTRGLVLRQNIYKVS